MLQVLWYPPLTERQKFIQLCCSYHWATWIGKEVEEGAGGTLRPPGGRFSMAVPHVDSQLFNNVVEPTVSVFLLAGVLITVSSI